MFLKRFQILQDVAQTSTHQKVDEAVPNECCGMIRSLKKVIRWIPLSSNTSLQRPSDNFDSDMGGGLQWRSTLFTNMFAILPMRYS